MLAPFEAWQLTTSFVYDVRFARQMTWWHIPRHENTCEVFSSVLPFPSRDRRSGAGRRARAAKWRHHFADLAKPAEPGDTNGEIGRAHV